MDDKHAEIRQQIDKEIFRLETRLSTLRTQRNRLAPISRLPVETMTRIFRLAHGGMYARIPLVLSFVSHNWRELALDLPELWTRINTQLKLKHIPAYIARSRQKPLHIALDKSGPNASSIRTITIILGELPRIRELTIHGAGSQRLLCCGDAVWDIQAPILEKLQLWGFEIPNTILAGSVPLLYELNLGLCRFEWNALPSLPQLQKLSITQPQVKIPVDDYLTQLHRIPRLRSISTINALTGARTSLQLTQFRLPNLHILSAQSEDCAHVAVLLRALVLPKVNHFSLQLHQDNPGDQFAIIDALDHCAPITSTPFKMMSIKARQHSCGFLVQCDHISAVLQFYYTSTTTNQDIYRVCRRLDLDFLSDLRLDFHGVVSDKHNSLLYRLFEPCLDLQYLTVRKDSVKTLANYLSTESKDLHDTLTNPPTHEDIEDVLGEIISFPGLKELVIRWSPNPLHLEAIAQYLRIREQCGSKLKGLILASKDSLPDELNNTLEESVDEFEVVQYDVNDEYDHLL
ncbi:hypothetical protein BDN72DRAFT_843556 [Pluteus cervinus]|uniref:Uncharacterized protein n=1 Tax=Pluteus cervinus TaxID=181527 RepID=A0ACD3AM42_9AGAR|nr:hypothetical protein BDN72DRAFT_843556 [Pluteus cervinus]